MAKDKLIPQNDKSISPVKDESLLHLRGRRAMIVTIGGAIAAWLSPAARWGGVFIDWLQRAEFLSDWIIRLLRWLFSPTGAYVVGGLFLIGFLIAAYRTVTSIQRATQATGQLSDPSNTAVASPDTAEVEQLRGRVKELEGERDGAVRERERIQHQLRMSQKTKDDQSVVMSSYRGLLDTYKWLHEMAEKQAGDIGNYVVVEQVRYCYHKLDAPIPHLVFGVDVWNKSVFDITIEDVLGGYIRIAGERLLGEKELIHNPKIPASGKESLTLKQRLNPTEVDLVVRCENEPLGAIYYFDKLDIMVAARREAPMFGRVPLALPQCVGSKDNENLQLKSALKRSELISKLSLALGGAYTLANLYEAGETPSKERIEHWLNSTLRGHIHRDYVDAICEGLPELTDSPAEQKALMEMYCSRLRRLIREVGRKE